MSRRTGTSMRSLSSGSITPMEDEDDKPKRSTRGRNPLPPTKGPLFPPLPPKVIRPKPSPRASQTDSTPAEAVDEQELSNVAGPSRLPSVEDARKRKQSTPDNAKPHVPSGSGTSLTPPPTSEPEALEQDQNGTPGMGVRPERNGRGSKGLDIKIEPDGEEGVEETPKQTRTSGSRLVPPGSGGTTPTGSVTSDNAAKTSAGRRRRGEGQLLLDDHLLPEEMRRTGKLTGKRGGHAEHTQVLSAAEKQEVEPEAAVLEQEERPVQEEEQADLLEQEEGSLVTPAPEPSPERPAEGADDGDQDAEQDTVDEDESEADGEEVTRCVCQLEDGDPLMVACDKCAVWQHGACVGIWADEEAPDEYFCEQCRPELHGPLRKWIRSKGRNIAHFIPPSPADLKGLHSPHDKYPPSQSKRWAKEAAKAKPPSKKEPQSPADPIARRNSRLPDTSSAAPPLPHREKSAGKHDVPVRDSRRAGSHHRKVSIDAVSPVRDSRSPTAMVGSKEKEPKRRSTMNSRDATFEDDVQAAIAASRLEMGQDGAAEDAITEEPEVAGNTELEALDVETKEMERNAKGKRKRDEEDPDAAIPLHPKSKHPNQYTYRPKPAPAAIPPVPSPARRVPQGTTPVPQAPPPALHEHGTRRAGALASGAREAPFIAVAVTHLGWHLPDYLSSFTNIFPTPIPSLLQVRSPRPLTQISKNHFFNHRYGPLTEERDDADKLLLPLEPVERAVLGRKGETHTEPPVRVKYPQRRITTSEMRKRVRHMLDYCGRVQVEEDRRGRRKGLVGIPDAQRGEASNDNGEDVNMDGEGGLSGSLPTTTNGISTTPPESSKSHSTPPPTSTSSGPTAAQLLAELTADLVDFQETWARGGFAATTQGGASGLNGSIAWNGYGGASPIPPASATFAASSSGWPTSGLARRVVGPDEADDIGATDEVDATEAEPEETSGEQVVIAPEPGVLNEAIDQEDVGAGGQDEANAIDTGEIGPADPAYVGLGISEVLDLPAPTLEGIAPVDPTSAPPDANSNLLVGSEMEHEQPSASPVDVYREGEVSEVITSATEDEAARMIVEEVARDKARLGGESLQRDAIIQDEPEGPGEVVQAGRAEEDVVMGE